MAQRGPISPAGRESLRSKSRPVRHQAGERAQEEGGADEEDEGEGHLEGDNRLAEADAAESATAALAERVDDVVTAGVQRGREAAEQPGGEAGQERKPEKVEAEARTERVGGQVVGQEGDEGAHETA